MAKKRTVSPFFGKRHQRLEARAASTTNLLEAIRIRAFIRLDLKHLRKAGGAA